MEDPELLALRWDPAQAHCSPVADGTGPPSGLLLGPSEPESADLEAVRHLLASDPRIASVSVFGAATEQGGPGREAPGWPAGLRFVLVGLKSANLVGDPRDPDGVVTASGMAIWAEAALHRGLRHVWVNSRAATVAHTTAPGWPGALMSTARVAGAPAKELPRKPEVQQPISVAVDARWLGHHETGAQVAATRFIEHLARLEGISAIHLHGLPGNRLPAYADALLRSPKVRASADPADVFWRPAQPDDRARIWLDRARGGRVVVTVLDLIEHTNPAYARDTEAWSARRRRTCRYLAKADVVTAISRDVLTHVRLEVPGVQVQRLAVTPLAVEGAGRPTAAEVPPALADLTRPFVLVLGNDYLHKNRDFAIRVFAEVAREHDVDLVLAGLTVPTPGASTAPQENLLLDSAGPLRDRIHLLPHVTSAQKRWLLSSAAVVHYPTSAEGFGLLPHEAADAGVPCVFTRFGPLEERFGGVPNPGSWAIAEHAARIGRLLADEGERRHTVELLQAAGRSPTWPDAAATLLAAFRLALALPDQSRWPWGHRPRAEATAAWAFLALQAGRDAVGAARQRRRSG
jgi:hypothetical protein